MDVLVPKGFVNKVSGAKAASRAILKRFAAGQPLPDCAGELVSLKATGHFVAMDVSGRYAPHEVDHVHVAPLIEVAREVLLRDREKLQHGREQLEMLWQALSEQPWGRLCISSETAVSYVTTRPGAARYLEVALRHWDELNGLGDIFLGTLHHLGEETEGVPFVMASTALRGALFTLGVPAADQSRVGGNVPWFRARAEECLAAFRAAGGV